MKALLLFAFAALPLVGLQDKKPDAPRGEKPAAQAADPNQGVIDFQKPCYPLKACAVCGHDLDKKTFDTVVDKHLVETCSDACKAGVEAKKADILKKIDDGVIAAQKANYPLDKCPISDEKLGGMGEPVDRVVGMRLVRLCCKNCVAKLDGNPEAALGKLERAYIGAQKASYKVTVCPVDGAKLDDSKAVDKLYGTTLVRLCSDDCAKTLARAPHRVLNQLDNLKAGKPFEAGEKGEKGEKHEGGGKEGHGEKKGGEKKNG